MPKATLIIILTLLIACIALLIWAGYDYEPELKNMGEIFTKPYSE